MTPDEIQQQLSFMSPWHHNVELAPGVWTNPKMGNHPTDRWKLIEPYVPQDLSGKTVLDLGCSSAFFSAMFKKRGAKRVVAVDLVDSAICEARLLTQVFETPVEIVQQDIYDFVIENQTQFDYIIFLGIFYHLRSPLFVLDKLVQMTRERLYFQTWVRNEGAVMNGLQQMLFAGYEFGVLAKRGTPRRALTSAWHTLTHPLELPDDICMENSYLLSHPQFPNMKFIEKCMNHDETNWWVGDTQTLRGILESTGFRRTQQLSEDTFICDNGPARPS